MKFGKSRSLAGVDENEGNNGPDIRRRSVQSIKVGSTLLECLAASTGPMPLSEVSRRAGMQPSKARRYLMSFLDCGLVEQDSVTGHYDLGPMSLRLGFAALSRMDPVRKTVEAAAALSREIDRTILVAVWCELGPIVIAWFDSSELLATNLRVGSVLPLTVSASGQLFLAYLPRQTTRPLVEKSIRQIRERTGESVTKVRKDIDELVEQARKTGVGRTTETLLPGLSAYAAPVFDSSGAIVASIAEIHRAGSAEVVQGRNVRDAVKWTASDVSTRLGYNWRH